MARRRAQFSYRALPDCIESRSAPVAYIWSHFLRKTRVHFSGKCSSPCEGRPNSIRLAALALLLPVLVTATVDGLSASSVAAQSSSESAPSPPNAPPSLQSSVNGYGNHDKLCLAWNDGCVTCQRDATAGTACSNIGIACQPKEITCTQRQPAPVK